MHNNLPIYEEDKCALFALGRNAIYAACQILGLKPDDEVLTPAFDCDTALQPFRVLGIKLQFFRSDPYTFFTDIDDIKRKITPRTKLIHIINHFGMPQPWDRLLPLKNETGIPILEDNAYSLFSRLNDRLFGTFGDLSIFSLRKNLPMVNGGMLRVNNPKYRLKLSSQKNPLFYFKEINSLTKITLTNMGFHKFFKMARYAIGVFDPAIETPPPLYSEEKRGYPVWPLRDVIGKEFTCNYLRPMSQLAKRQLKNITEQDYSYICNRKRQFYIWLVNEIGRIKGIKILWPILPEGLVPFCLSLLIDENRDIFLESLRGKYEVMAWPTLPKLVLDQLKEFSEVELLGRKLLQINLPTDKIRLSGFPVYLKNLVHDIYRLSKSNL